jgi:glycosyltransferase 2 family protein
MKLPSARSIVRLAFAAGVTAWLFHKSHPAEVVTYTAQARIAPLLMALALVLVDRTLMAYRSVQLLRPYPAAQRVPFLQLLRIFFVSTFVGSFLPASVGADAVRATSLARLQVPLADAVASVFMDRVLGVLSILIMGAVGLALAQDLPERNLIVAGLVVTAAGCATVALMVFNTRGAQLIVAMLEKLPSEKLHRAGRALIDAVRRYASHHGLLASVLLSSIAVQILRIVQAYFLGRALGIEAPVVVYFAFIPVILLVMLLPITINGLGTSQAGFVALFTHANASQPQAFALSILFVALGVVGNLPGGFLYLWSGLGPSAPPTPVSDPSQAS